MYNRVILTRGDTASVCVDVLSETGLSSLSQSDVLYFGLADFKQPFEYALLKKRFTAADLTPDGKLIITFAPSDTLDLLPGTYYGTVKMRRGESGEVLTVIDRAKIIINA